MVGICRGEDGNSLNDKFELGEHINSRGKGLTVVNGLLARVARGRLRCDVGVNLSGKGKRAGWG
jgi:hypothetical protein